MAKPLRLGVIGLGRRWRRGYKPALAALADLFAVRAVYDQVQRRADQEARQLNCHAVDGLSLLVERDDLDGVLLADSQWFGLWPLESLCQVGKPVLWGVPLSLDDAHADRLVSQVRDSRLPVLVEMAFRGAPVAARLRELLQSDLGPARLVRSEVVRSQLEARPHAGLPRSGGAAGLLGAQGIGLVDWCCRLLGGEPASVRAVGLEAADFASVFWEFDGGRGVQIVQRRSHLARPGLRLQVLAERGSAAIEWPSRVSWTNRDGKHVHILPKSQPFAQTMLEWFYQVIREGRPPEPNLEDAYRVLGWLRAAQHSLAEDRRIDLKPTFPS